MKITINAFGSRGDVQPYVALGVGLLAAGCQVRITTHRIFEDFIRDHCLDFYPLEIDPRQVLINQAVAEFGNNTLRTYRWIKENFSLGLEYVYRATLDSSADADLMLNSSLSFAGWHVAQKLDMAAIAVYIQPGTPCFSIPSMAAPLPPAWLPFKGAYYYASTKISNQLFLGMLRSMNNTCREKVLDLPPLSPTYYWHVDSPFAGVPMLYGYSPSMLPRPKNWGPSIQVTGYWFLEGANSYTPSSELLEFLSLDPKPIYIGFGSMVDHEHEQITKLVIDALEILGARAILSSGWSELGEQTLPENIMRVDYVPHDWLFPKVAAVVHHGGAGTTAAGLRAGVPSVVIPFFGDQPFWGWVVHNLRVGPKAVQRKVLTAKKLAYAIEQAVNDPGMREHARNLGARIRQEHGVQTAVDLITGGFGQNFRIRV
jgi:sterol 3beta-glucosyltransferase